MKPIYAVVTITIVGIVGFLVYTQSTKPQQITPATSTPLPTPTTEPKEVNYQASFAIFTNGTFRVFTAAMYHNLSKDVYIESTNPNVIHVKKKGITYDDFFKTLPFKLTKDCLTTGTGQTFCTGNGGTLKFYLNGAKTDDLLVRQIKDSDKVRITFGTDSETQIQNQLTQVPKP